MASAMGATAFQKSLGINHSIAHGLGVYFDLHHGLANAAVLKEVMIYNMQEKGVAEKLAHLSMLLGGQRSAEAFIELLSQWLTGVGMPTNLKSFDIPASMIPKLEAYALEDPCCSGNPRKVVPGDVADILKKLI